MFSPKNAAAFLQEMFLGSVETVGEFPEVSFSNTYSVLMRSGFLGFFFHLDVLLIFFFFTFLPY